MKGFFLVVLPAILFFSTAKGQCFFEVETTEEAEVKLWFVDDESTCDYRILFVYTPEEAKTTGHWCEVDAPEKADMKIIFVDDPSLADMNVCMTMDAAQAGWINEKKEGLLPF